MLISTLLTAVPSTVDKLKDKIPVVKATPKPSSISKLPKWVMDEISKIPGAHHVTAADPTIVNGAAQEWTGSYGVADNAQLNLTETIKHISSQLQEIVDKTKDMYSYIQHPSKIVYVMWKFAVNNSLTVCIILSFGGLIIGLVGVKKGYKISVISFFVYLTIQIFNTLIGG